MRLSFQLFSIAFICLAISNYLLFTGLDFDIIGKDQIEVQHPEKITIHSLYIHFGVFFVCLLLWGFYYYDLEEKEKRRKEGD